MKTASQRIAARIAEIARRNGARVWQLEDLQLVDMKEGKPWLAKNWAPGMVRDAIKWQADQLGADLVLVNPRYTSQRCSRCGHIDRDNRPKQAGNQKAAYFKCKKCGHDEDADKNAARNLSIRGIEDLITEGLPRLDSQ